MGATAAKLRGELRRLITDEVPADYLGAFTDDPAEVVRLGDFCLAAAAAARSDPSG